MLNKEKERLLKEGERLALRDNVIKNRLEEIDVEMNSLQQPEATVKTSGNESYPGRQNFTQRNVAKKEWKKMPLNY
jgi:predicted nuclease with TOPRIM domain